MNEKGIVLIVGANGKLGRALAEQFSEEYLVIGTTRRGKVIEECDKTIFTSDLFEDKGRIVIEATDISRFLGIPIKMVIYVAGFGYNENLITPEIKKEMYKVNVFTAQCIAQAFCDVKFIYTSSCAVYGIKETKGLKTYAETKRAAEKTLKNILPDLVILRPSTIPDTDFAKRAQLKEFSSIGFPNSEEVAKYVLEHLNEDLILPG